MIISKELQAQWVAALRSGKYKQGNGQLRAVAPNDEMQYCCLGVLCELDPRVEWCGNGCAVTGHDIVWRNSIPYYPGIDDLHFRFLAYLNDSGLSFSQIADVIENGHLALKDSPDDVFNAGPLELPDWSKE